jgi:hypothetical protein
MLEEQWEKLGQTQDFGSVVSRLKERGVIVVTNGSVTVNKARADEILEVTTKNPEVAALKLVNRRADLTLPELVEEWALLGHSEPLDVVLHRLQERGVV